MSSGNSNLATVLAGTVTAVSACVTFYLGRRGSKKDKAVESAKRDEESYKDLLEELGRYLLFLADQNPQYREHHSCQDLGERANEAGETGNSPGSTERRNTGLRLVSIG